VDGLAETQRQHEFRANDTVIALYQAEEVDGEVTSIYAPGRVCTR
jgi:hypothetical protein